MSDIENKTENNTETKTAETAPYMKKDKQQKAPTESSKSNIFIPLALLLVSAMVIVSTFYQDEYNDLVSDASLITETQDEAATPEAENDNTATAAQAAKVNHIAENNIATAPEAATTEVQVVTVTTEAPANTETKAVSTTKQDTMRQQSNDRIANMQARAADHRARMQAAYAPRQPTPYATNQLDQNSYQQARSAAMVRAQAQAKKHNEMMQQHRQAYEKEMQARRQQYEAAMKAQQEKRAQIAETQKTVFQSEQQTRIENKQRILEMHQQISKMHDEIHQIMRDSQPQFRNNSAPQMQQPETDQQLQSI